MEKELCTYDPLNTEYTLCGRAFDDEETIEGPPVFAKPGEKITCIGCRSVIKYCKSFKHYTEKE